MRDYRKVSGKVKALPGEIVMVRNYRKKYDQWEEGEVMSVELSVGADLSTKAQYSVLAVKERVSRRHPHGKRLWLYVGDVGIYKITGGRNDI